jgi:hypothetical protein
MVKATSLGAGMPPNLWKFVKSNSAAVIIGAAIIIGLNLPYFINAAQSLWYEVSGQAAREQEKNQQAMKVKAEWLQERKTMTEAWNSFLLTGRGNDNPEIKISKSASGDTRCMDTLVSLSIHWDRTDHFADMFIKYLNQNAILSRTDWEYEMLDDDFFSDAHMASESKDIQYNKGYGGCETPRYLYRRNRYQQHIE